jgi:hypothetical protein
MRIPGHEAASLHAQVSHSFTLCLITDIIFFLPSDLSRKLLFMYCSSYHRLFIYFFNSMLTNAPASLIVMLYQWGVCVCVCVCVCV